MHLSSLILIGSGSLAPVALATGATCPSVSTACCRGPTGVVASALKGFAPAQTFCSNKHPVPRQTCTSVAPKTTMISTVATITKTKTVGTEQITTTAAPVTITISSETTPTVTETSTEIDTETDTAFFTITLNSTVTFPSVEIAKRAKPTPYAVDPKVAQFNNLKGNKASFIAAVCTCIAKPQSTTVTIHPSTIKRVTATVTLSVTAKSTATVVPTTSLTVVNTADPVTTTLIETIATTATTTNTITETTTSSVTESSSAAAQFTALACNPSQAGGNVQGAGGCSSGCFYDKNYDSTAAYCVDDGFSTTVSYTSDSDCPTGSFCDATVGNICDSGNSCSSSYSSALKRDYLGDWSAASGSVRRVGERPVSE